jgi:hypothetical protein
MCGMTVKNGFDIGNVPSIGAAPERDAGSAGVEHGYADLAEVIALLPAMGGRRNPGSGGSDEGEEVGGVKQQRILRHGKARKDSGENVTLQQDRYRNWNLIHLFPEMLRSEWIEVHAGQSTQGGLLRPWGEGALARRVAGVADDDQRQRLSDRVTIGFGPGSSAARGSGTNVPLVLQSASGALHLPSTGVERGDSGEEALRV